MPRSIPTVEAEWNSHFMSNLKRFGGDDVNNTWIHMHSMLKSWAADDYTKFNESLTAFKEAEAEVITKARAFLSDKEVAIDKREAAIEAELRGLSGKEYMEKKESILTRVKNNRSYLAKQKELWGSSLGKTKFERFYNQFSPFYLSMACYIMIFAIGCFGLLGWRKGIWKFSMCSMLIVFTLHVFAIWCRYYISGYPPVTNLYSSAIFIGWGVVAAAIVLEFMFKRYFALLGGAIAGATCLFISHNLLDGEDTMGMMRAVLDTKFWLATHVVTIALGYTACFLAGAIGFWWILCKLCGRVRKSLEKDFSRAIYGLVCYGMFLSFVGTVLGGLWADDSWGRFWGWDTKENGALMIVIWNALILHARWSGMVRMRGLAALAVIGNIITGFSWFGVNLLGVGLHSYGFTDSGYSYLVGFCLLNFVFVILCMIPFPAWNKFAKEKIEADDDETETDLA
ncbi:MAG: cytochrome c biogenesis protein CcsA [Lentisphaeraceae bacterium]|nr:cytochrome c biogenesis protein CcsA [Lentisphaeraceae bacterium]